ncbi:hypothetical protein ACFL20_07950 [Spirochaetota bacterium]
MHFIKPCSSCGKKIRFPLNKGRIKVSCICGYSFFIDPDDPDTFKSGKFDINGRKKGSSIFNFVSEKILEVDYNKIKINIINGFYDFNYKLQNFKLLPKSEKKKLLITLSIIFAVLVVFFIIVRALSGPNVPENVI